MYNDFAIAFRMVASVNIKILEWFKVVNGRQCAKLVRFKEQWIKYVFLELFSFYNIVYHLLYDNELDIKIIDLSVMKLVRVKNVAN